jgi:alpha-mannosidase
MLGTDHMQPSPLTSAAIVYANNHLPDTQVVHSTIPAYLERVKNQVSQLEKSLPTLRGELRACDHSHLLPGVLSTRMWIKQRNLHSQTLLEKWAEPFSVFAGQLVDPPAPTSPVSQPLRPVTATNRLKKPAPIIRHAWHLLMENHPHDSICGCSIDQVHDEMKPRFDQVDQIGEEVTLQALRAISEAVDTSSGDAFSSVVLYNPHGFTNQGIVEFEANIPEDISVFEIVDGEDKALPYEFVGSSSEELANILVKKESLRDTIGYINEGQVAGFAISDVKVTREGAIATIDAVLDPKGKPNIRAWQQAEEIISEYEADPAITHFHLIAQTPQATMIRLMSPTVPALGWRTIWLRAVEPPPTSPAAEPGQLVKALLPLGLRLAQSKLGGKLMERISAGDESKPPFIIENEHFQIKANRADGTITVVDKHTNTTLSGLNRFIDGGDAGDEYNYCPPENDSFFTPKVTAIKVYRHKQIPTLEISYEMELPSQLSQDRSSRSKDKVRLPITSHISLAPGAARIEVRTWVDNQAKDHRLRVHFPAPFNVQQANYDGHFQVVGRAVGVAEPGEDWVEDPRPEVPQGAFTDISSGEIGMMIANRGLPEVEVIDPGNGTGSEIALTLLRAVGWLSRDDMAVRKGHAGPATETPGAQIPGRWAFEYAIIPHEGDWEEAYQQAYAYQAPLRGVETGLHAGQIQNQGSFVSHSPTEFVISAVKETEDGQGWLVRGYNITPEPIVLELKPLRRFTSVAQANLAEDVIQPLEFGENGSVSLPVTGHQIVSIRFED